MYSTYSYSYLQYSTSTLKRIHLIYYTQQSTTDWIIMIKCTVGTRASNRTTAFLTAIH
jgi:hypothetical protein